MHCCTISRHSFCGINFSSASDISTFWHRNLSIHNILIDPTATLLSLFEWGLKRYIHVSPPVTICFSLLWSQCSYLFKSWLHSRLCSVFAHLLASWVPIWQETLRSFSHCSNIVNTADQLIPGDIVSSLAVYMASWLFKPRTASTSFSLKANSDLPVRDHLQLFSGPLHDSKSVQMPIENTLRDYHTNCVDHLI